MSLQSIKKILAHEQLAPLKKLGQNFLIHSQTAARIVGLAGITSEDTVVEVGVGLGSLTGPLAKAANKVIGLELDSGIINWQQSEGNLEDNVTLIHQDVLKADFKQLAEQCGGRLKIVANLPYSISNSLIFKLLDNQQVMDSAVLMLQKEVGMRLAAGPGTKEYGILSVLLAGAASVTRLLNVGPEQFHPRPKVDSVVVKISFHPKPQRAKLLPEHDQQLLRKVVKGGFGKRRKTLLNALSTSSLLSYDKDIIRQTLESAGIAPSIRAEKLTIEEFVAITRQLETIKPN